MSEMGLANEPCTKRSLTVSMLFNNILQMAIALLTVTETKDIIPLVLTTGFVAKDVIIDLRASRSSACAHVPKLRLIKTFPFPTPPTRS